MKKLSVLACIAIFLTALSATSVQAQYRPGKTSSEKAAYGYPSEAFSARKKKNQHKRHKSKKKSKQQPANKNKKPLFRKKSPWAS